MNNPYKNKTILILGLGTYGGGLGAATFLARQGARLIITDIKTRKQLKFQLQKLYKFKNISYVLGGHKNLFIFQYDLAIVNPAIDLRSPIVREIKKRRIPIDTELSLFLKHCQGKVIAITGTKGKSTTAALMYHILKKAGKRVVLGGNIGVSLLKQLPRITKNTYVVLEISSFQLDLIPLPVSFYITALTNIYPDHLDRYNSFADYKRSKLKIFKHPAKYRIKNKELRITSWINPKKIKLLGEHNFKNIALATKIAELLKIPKNKIARAIYSFKDLEHRLEFVKNVRGVSWYNDSASTTPDSTIAALRAFKYEVGPHTRKLTLIAGGVLKGSPLQTLGKEIVKRASVVILFGRDAKKIKQTLPRKSDFRIIQVQTLRQSVRHAHKHAQKGDIVLFSPATASFDQFVNASQRGKEFKKLVLKL